MAIKSLPEVELPAVGKIYARSAGAKRWVGD